MANEPWRFGETWIFQSIQLGWAGVPAAAPDATRTRVPRSFPGYLELGTCESQADRDEKVHAVLQFIRAGHPQGNPRHPQVWEELRRLLPPGGFAPFLERHPDRYALISTFPLQWTRK